jgi:3-oxoacyl-[acyl-carrier-protein] synthase III
MFKLLVIACAIADPKMCITFEDTLKKLETEQQCIERAYEMRRDIVAELEDMKPMVYKCIELQKGKFT